MSTYQRNDDGSWSPAVPIGPIGWKAKSERWFRGNGMNRIANLLGRWDERGLGK